jgi:putative RNA 2'-phosphotransferase
MSGDGTDGPQAIGDATDDADLVAASRRLALVLRHRPGLIGVMLDPAGWVEVDTLLAALARYGRPLSRTDLDRIVAGTDKRRYEVHGGRIRAAQGHSVPIDLELPPAVPPAVLYHGTVARFLPGIRRDGLRPGRRRHVHLSPDEHTATVVGRRRGSPVVLRVDAAGLHAAGHTFYRAANGVWLTDRVPPQWIDWPDQP